MRLTQRPNPSRFIEDALDSYLVDMRLSQALTDVLIPAYEWPVVLLAVVGLIAIVRRPTTTGALLVWTSVLSLAIYSWASERMPWLVVHPLLPLILLAGVGAQTLWDRRTRGWARVAMAVAAVLAVGWVYSSIQLAYFRSADARDRMSVC